MPPLIFFDIDQTLAESKQPIAPSMADALAKLLASTGVGIISGDTLEIVMRNVADRLPEDADRSRLYLLPTSGAALYRFEDGWQQVYEESLSAEEAERIDDAILSAVKETGCIDMDAPAYGKRIENRGAQVSISALGQEAPLEEKRAWDPSGAKRDILRAAIAQRLPEYDVARGGMTTIDVTRKGVNKAYGVRKLAEFLHLSIPELLYVGDALYDGGNDAIVKETGVPTHAVKDPDETERLIRSFV